MAPAPRARRPRHRLRDRRSGRDAAGHRAHGDDPGPGRDLTCAGRGHCSLLGDELRWRAAELPEILVAIVDVALALELGEGTVVAAPVDGHGCSIPPGLEQAGRHAAERGHRLKAMALRHLLEADPAQGGFRRGEDHLLAVVQRMRVRGLDGAVRPHPSARPSPWPEHARLAAGANFVSACAFSGRDGRVPR